MMELHIVSTGRQSLAELAGIAGEIHPYVTAFHLREKTKTARELLEGIGLMLAAGVSLGQIRVNDRADVAAAAGVRGVHLAHHSLDIGDVKRLFPGLAVGKSVHSGAEALQAEAEGADYVFYGHIYPTASKPDLPARGIKALGRVSEIVNIPVIAIGGITPPDIAALTQAGASGAAVMSGVLDAEDPLREVQAYRHFLDWGVRDE
jgi:thiazole tautomerase (transcriptional regulator TenI)